MNHDGLPLENRIVTALAATDITSCDLSQLLVEADAAIAVADKMAEEERTRALDPVLSPDSKTARQAMEDSAFTRDRLKTLLPRLQTKHKELADAEALAAWQGEAAEMEERRVAMGTKFAKEYPGLMNPILNQLWDMRHLDQEVRALNNRRPINAANAAGVRFLDFITPAFAPFLKIPDPEVGEHSWTNGSGYLWPPPQPNLALRYLATMPPDPFIISEAAKGTYIDNRNRQIVEDNQRVAEAAQRQREREEREAAEARKAQEAERAAYYAKHGWPM